MGVSRLLLFIKQGARTQTYRRTCSTTHMWDSISFGEVMGDPSPQWRYILHQKDAGPLRHGPLYGPTGSHIWLSSAADGRFFGWGESGGEVGTEGVPWYWLDSITRTTVRERYLKGKREKETHHCPYTALRGSQIISIKSADFITLAKKKRKKSNNWLPHFTPPPKGWHLHFNSVGLIKVKGQTNTCGDRISFFTSQPEVNSPLTAWWLLSILFFGKGGELCGRCS